MTPPVVNSRGDGESRPQRHSPENGNLIRLDPRVKPEDDAFGGSWDKRIGGPEDDAFGEFGAWGHAYFGSREWMCLEVWDNAFGNLMCLVVCRLCLVVCGFHQSYGMKDPIAKTN